MDSIWLEVILIAVGILANGFFAGSEFALVSSRISRLTQMKEAGVRGAGTAIEVKQAPEAFLATIQIAITMVGTLASAVGGATAVEALTPALARLGLGQWAETLALAIVIVIITYFSLVVGELAPKAIALRNPEAIAAAVARPIRWLSRATGVVVRVLTASTNALLRLVGLGASSQSPFVSEEDVRYLLREGAARGVFDRAEEELVHNVFEFGDTTVREIMVPRIKIQALDVTTPPEQVLRHVAEIGHSRIPVYEGSLEHPIGILIHKDVVKVVARGEMTPLREIVRPPLFIPETSKISVLLRELQRHRQNLAIVVDEYGRVVGLVTLEDVLEEIVGDIREEGERETPPGITRLPDGSVIVEGTTSVEELRDRLGVAVPESTDYNTAAGFLIDRLNGIPWPGTSLSAAGYRWTVLEMDGPRIAKIKLQREAGGEAPVAGGPRTDAR